MYRDCGLERGYDGRRRPDGGEENPVTSGERRGKSSYIRTEGEGRVEDHRQTYVKFIPRRCKQNDMKIFRN